VRVVITQPTYLPWIGYFDLMDQVDRVVVLDSVQFEKRSWQQRNRIKTPHGLEWLTVPVTFQRSVGQRIQDVKICQPSFWEKHLRVIEHNYRRAPYFDLYFPQLLEALSTHGEYPALVNLNLCLIEWFFRVLGIGPKLICSSDLDEKGKRCELLVNLCRRLEADFYLSPLGSAGYLLQDLDLFSEAGIQVAFQNYDHPQYRQMFQPFCPYASVLDLVFNEGDRSMEIIRSGRRLPFTPDQVALASTVGDGAMTVTQ
jgi:hypothetical protein